MNSTVGFWSYVHVDDEAESGRIADLARDVVAQYGLLTGDSIELFLDKDALEWGDKWEGKRDASLVSAAFFIPVLTPRYFKSFECRRELQHFAREAKSLGVKELVMPLLYVDVPALHATEPDDGLVLLVREFQWEDWTRVRFAERASDEYRGRVAALAERLVRANAEAQTVDVASAVLRLAGGDEVGDDEPGIIDRLAASEEAMPKWTETLERIGNAIVEVGTLVDGATVEMKAGEERGKGFAARLTVAKKLARDLERPASEIQVGGNAFADQLHAVDSGIRAIIEQAPAEVAQDSSSREQVCEFFATVRGLSQAAHESLGLLGGMIEAMTPAERSSRDLRPPLKAMRQGLTLMLEGRAITDDWLRLIDESPIECE